jgi:hypothetical protein
VDLLLHLGAHRCASTTFQSYLWNNRVKLSKQGLTSWTPKRTRDGLLRGLVRHPALITIMDEKQGMRSIGRLRVEMARLRNNGQKALLISEENILGSMRNNILDTRLYSLLRERLMRFQPAFDGQKLTIGLSIRSYEDYWTSCLANLVTRGSPLPTVDLLDFLTTQPRRWRAIVRDIAAAFPEADIVVSPFERMANQPNVQLRALWPQDFHGLEDGNLWRSRGADLPGLNTILALRGEAAIHDGPIEAGTRWMPFDEDQRSVLRAEYRRDLAWLASGAEGLARYVDGRPAPTPQSVGVRIMDNQLNNQTGSGRPTPAPCPDRGDMTRTTKDDVVLLRGQNDGIEKGLGRTSAS